MNVKIVKEPKDLCRKFGIPTVFENCCFCHDKTQYWCEEKDVAVCPSCAQYHDLESVPNKQEWCRQVDQRLKK